MGAKFAIMVQKYAFFAKCAIHLEKRWEPLAVIYSTTNHKWLYGLCPTLISDD